VKQEDLAVPVVELDSSLTLDYDEVDPTGYRYAEAHGISPRYSFGYGLSYTEFVWSEVELLGTDRLPIVSVRLSNTGPMPGREVVQVYAAAPHEDSARLVGFQSIELVPGESTTVQVTLDHRWCERWLDNKWIIPAGRHVLRVGTSSTNTEKAFEVLASTRV
jgi:beta-glucosidase